MAPAVLQNGNRFDKIGLYFLILLTMDFAGSGWLPKDGYSTMESIFASASVLVKSRDSETSFFVAAGDDFFGSFFTIYPRMSVFFFHFPLRKINKPFVCQTWIQLFWPWPAPHP